MRPIKFVILYSHCKYAFSHYRPPALSESVMGGITKNASIIVLDSPDSDRQIGAGTRFDAELSRAAPF